jgi:quercetin dioxygenase-like cupin family protein
VDAQHVDVAALLAERDAGVLWSSTSQLQSNVVALPAGGRVDEHVETALDVLLVVVAGGGRLTHRQEGSDAVEQDLVAPAVCLLPAGTRRSLAAGPDGLVLVTAHRARPPFMPGRSGPP